MLCFIVRDCARFFFLAFFAISFASQLLRIFSRAACTSIRVLLQISRRSMIRCAGCSSSGGGMEICRPPALLLLRGIASIVSTQFSCGRTLGTGLTSAQKDHVQQNFVIPNFIIAA